MKKQQLKHKRAHKICDQSYKINTVILAPTSLSTNMFVLLITFQKEGKCESCLLGLGLVTPPLRLSEFQMEQTFLPPRPVLDLRPQ